MTIARFIAEQPEVLESVLTAMPPQLAACGPFATEDPVCLVGSGTSLNALAAVESLLDRLTPAGVRLRGPLQFLAELEESRPPRGSVLVLSQTGTSVTTVEAVRRAQARGMRVLTLTAERDSPIGAVAEELLVMPVGPEPVGPKTKGYTASLLTLILLARVFRGEPVDARELPAEISQLIAYSRGVVAELAERCADADFVLVLGQGRHHATALEGSLKITEMAGIAAAAFDTEEAFHGRFHGLGPESLALFVAATPDQQEMAAVGAAALTDLGVQSRILNLTGTTPGPHDLPLPWPDTGACPSLDLLGAIVPFQWLACELAMRRGLPPERMRYPDMSGRLRIKTKGGA